jgi:adenosine kinase
MQALDQTSHSEGGIDVLFFCNPLLDISIEDSEDGALLKKYNLTAGQAVLATPEQHPIYDEIFNMDGRLLVPGGSALNSARACGWSFNKQTPGKGKVAYIGCIGKDKRGETLQESLVSCGVQGIF